MRRLIVIPVVILVTSVARAEEPVELLDLTNPPPPQDLPGPELRLEPLPRLELDMFDAVRERAATRVQLGTRTWATLEGSWWSTERDAPAGAGTRHRPGHGWRTGLRLSHDFGWLHLDASVATGRSDERNEGDNRDDGGAYTDTRLSLSHTLRLSRWMTGWIALSLVHRDWHGPPPPGEFNLTELMLTIGTTFR
jgi:hypothetical protein